MTTDLPSTPGALVANFIARLEANDLAAALEMLTPDCIYDNVPFGAVRGTEAVRSTLAPFLAAFHLIEWQVHNQLESGTLAAGVVLNERLDRFGATNADNSVEWLELAIAGVFEVRDGRISLWRDYFDRAVLVDWMGRHG